MKHFIIENGVTREMTDAEVAELMALQEPELTAAQMREEAYNSEKFIEWDSEMLTVTEAATLWQYYAAEGSEKAAQLQVLVAEAKAKIREEYPDEEVAEV